MEKKARDGNQFPDVRHLLICLRRHYVLDFWWTVTDSFIFVQTTMNMYNTTAHVNIELCWYCWYSPLTIDGS